TCALPISERGGQQPPESEEVQVVARHGGRQPKALDVARRQPDGQGAPGEVTVQLLAGREYQAERLERGPAARPRGGEALATERKLELPVAPGVGEDERDAPAQRVGQVGKGELVDVVHDVLPWRRHLAGRERE